MRRWWLACATAMALGACAHAMRRGVAGEPTLEVVNAGPSAVELHVILGASVLGDIAGFALGTVFAGRTACYRLQSSALLQLRIVSGEGAFYTTTIYPASQPAWRLELRGYPQTDRLALQPADEPCEPGH